MAERDPYRYFRIEAREILERLAQGLLAMERGGADGDERAALMRSAHTLKGAARVVKLGALADDAHRLEDLIGSGGALDEMHEIVARIERVLDALNADRPAAPAPVPPPDLGEAPAEAVLVPGRPLREVRVAVDDLDAVLDGLDLVGARLARLRELTTALAEVTERGRALAEVLGGPSRADAARRLEAGRGLTDELVARIRSIAAELPVRLDDGDGELAEVRERARQLRVVRLGLLFPALERAAHDSARAMGRQVRFEAAGADIRVDAHVLSGLQEALVHLVQNAVAHGIEPPRDREAAGKPAAGRLRVEVAHRGHLVDVTVADDGRGIDLAAVRAAAERLGLLGEGASNEEALRLVFARGVSTAAGVTLASGRGIGLEVVQEVGQRLRGEVDVASEPGQGARFRLSVPVSLSSMTLLWVVAGGRRFGVPLGAVRGAVPVRIAEAVRSGDGLRVPFGDRVLPYASLVAVLGEGEAEEADGTGVVVRGPDGEVVLGVHHVLGTTDALVRPLPPALGPAPGLLGAVLDARGDPDLVLDPVQLARLARAVRPHRAPGSPERLPALVVDDSLTTRMLVQSILESAGYEVDTATSGEQGLEMARARRYGILLVDVEMPGMDGFEVLARRRADPRLAEVPVVMVTSRSTPEDLARAEALGADAYVRKGEFDQRRFLDVVRRLVR